MTPDQTFEVLHGDCLDAMRAMPDESVDAIVTDPPYGLSTGPSKYLGDEGSKTGYFGKTWDHGVPGPPFWIEALRVIKPGGHLMAFGGSRTFHRLAVAIEDSGWDYKDTLCWHYASGYPHAMSIAKAIDASDRIGFSRDRALKFTAFMREVGFTAKELNAATNSFMGSHFLTDKEQPQVATEEMFAVLRPMIRARGFDIPDEIEEFVRARTTESENLKRRRVTGTRLMADFKNSRPVAAAAQGLDKIDRREVEITTSHTEEAKKWEGWHTCLKPATEFISLARKPFKGTVGRNVAAYGTGALNIDACRIPYGEGEGDRSDAGQGAGYRTGPSDRSPGFGGVVAEPHDKGRWPANLIHDGSEEVIALFPFDADGSAARFFFVAKPSAEERHAGANDVGLVNRHATLKPVSLMRVLTRLVTPPGGTVLDMFCGSGTTGVAARHEGFRFIGCDLDIENVRVARARIAAIDMQPDLFHIPLEAHA